MRIDREGNLYIHIAGQLFKIDKDQQSATAYDLSSLGVYDLVGDYDFFANGDILIRRGSYNPGLVQGMLMFQRVIDNSEPEPHSPNEGLFRCRLGEGECLRFGNIDFNSAFHMVIDAENDNVYISDTNRSKIRKYNSEGVQLAVEENEFWFPNHNSLWNQQLVVADTNHHAIKFLDTKTEQFGKVQQQYAVNVPDFGFKTWVFSFARVGENWWVNNMGNDMAYGSLGVFNDKFKFQHMIDLPKDADPNDIVVFANQVFISDLANNRLYQLDFQGNLLEPSLPALVSDVMSSLESKRTIYISIKYLSIVLFVIFILGGFLVAFMQNRKS